MHTHEHTGTHTDAHHTRQANPPVPNMKSQFNTELLGKCMLHTAPSYPPGVSASAATRDMPDDVAEPLDPTVLFTTFVNTYVDVCLCVMCVDVCKSSARDSTQPLWDPRATHTRMHTGTRVSCAWR